MNEIPKMLHMSKAATRRRVLCNDCGEEREIILAPTAKVPARCIKCSRKRAAYMWNGRKPPQDEQ
jgi:ribosomal protein S14